MVGVENETSLPSLLVLFGPLAVGKMTVGQELELLTGFRLLYNHQTIDLISQYFPWSNEQTSPFWRLVTSYRIQLFEEAARASRAMERCIREGHTADD